MAGQASHFINYAPKLVDDPAKIAYARDRYVNELNRLCGVLEHRLIDRDYVAGDYSIADIASWPWARTAHRLGQDMTAFPKLQAWIDRIGAREAVKRGVAVGADLRKPPEKQSAEELRAQARTLFGQTAASVDAACDKAKVS